MKPAGFEYHAPASLGEAIALLARYGEDAKVLAGGQSLVPAMNFRLARPEILIDVNRVAGLDSITVSNGQVRIGALCRHARFEQPVAQGPLGQLLPRVAACIAHAPIRSRGTVGGSLAHADPASEWCALALALEADIVVEGPGGERVIGAGDFFVATMTTTLQANELLTQIRLPLLDASWRCGFAEYSRRAGDFALAMAVVAIRLAGGRIVQAQIALGGIAAKPVTAPAAAVVLMGQPPSETLWEAAAAAASAVLDPPADIHGSSEYRRDLAGAMLRRALRQAVAA